MPKPVDSGQRYMPGLDGLRAIAVLAVIAYHEQFGWAQGGLLGVGVFFTLSGFLITSLLIEQWSGQGQIKLGDFWLRRARRLLPALFVMLAIVTAWVTIADRARLANLRGAVGAAAGYFSNWYYIAHSQSYFSRFAPPQPLDHLWSLAVEEQFYVLWPILLMGGLLLARRRRKAAPRWLIVPTAVLTAVSVFLMVHLYQPGLDPTRVYEGTDTRAFGLLIGAMLALAWPVGRAVKPRLVGRWLIDAVGIAGLITIGVMIWRVGEYSPFAYRGGLVLLSFATVAVVAGTAVPGTMVGLALGCRPLRWIGARSYGIYLWHYPVIVLTTPPNSKPDLVRAALQIGAAIGLAALSWHFIEEPIRHGAIGKLWAQLRTAGSLGKLDGAANLSQLTSFGGLAATAGTTAVLIVAGVGLSGVVHGPADGKGPGSVLAAGSLQLPVTKSVTKSVAKPSAKAQAEAKGKSKADPWPTVSGPLRTACRAVAHIGDSTSDGLVSPEYEPNPKNRIIARYEDVGVQTVVTDVSGARSVVEVLPGQVNGFNAAKNIYHGGFRGCWVIALGTNDTADVAAGSTYSLMFRIKEMMAATHGEPVMWVNVISLLDSGPYAEANMSKWDQTLLRACKMYPNMRVFNWAALARRSWFISDGIHYTSIGYMHRAKDIADALAKAFPAVGHSPGCVVSS
ncbi:MAG TPA: acyltransferase family protein [Streptosporangiaceae bacterium]|jgi:peptidoglycan/LPS O-acetylase OafA/YrhL|nr:acyltransferase family protein [Streptosporangiaceae bacterium]